MPEPTECRVDHLKMRYLAEALRGELLYVHATCDVADSIRNSGELLAQAEKLLGAPEAEGLTP